MAKKYYKLELGKSNEQTDPSYIGKWDSCSIHIISDIFPSPMEAANFCNPTMEKLGYDMVCSVTELTSE